MPTTLTETANFDSTVTVPVAGDARTAASVVTPIQTLANRTRALIGAVSGLIVGRRRVYTATPVAGLGVFVGGCSIVIGDALLTIAPDAEVPGTLPLPAASAWYYVYAYDSAGIVALQVSSDPPDATLTWRSTDPGTHRYLGTIRTDYAGNPLALESDGGAYLWRTPLPARQTLISGSATTPTDVSCASYAPPHARILRLHLSGFDTGGSSKTASLSRDGDGVTAVLVQIPASTRVSSETELPCSTAQVVDYYVSSADAQLTVSVMGWRE